MKTTRLLLVAVAATAALIVTAEAARADGAPLGCSGPGCGAGYGGCAAPGGCGWHTQKYPCYYTFGNLACGGKGPLPVYQAAPWYLYWPYDGHFLTPAPVSGAFFGPPNMGNFPVNPYFPGPNYAYGYAPIPAGPPPMPAIGQPLPPYPGQPNPAPIAPPAGTPLNLPK
jgi:hypothetical protein